MEDKIVLGSGKLYVIAFSDTIPEDTVLEVDNNLLGYIQGGATLSYTPSFYEAKDDLGFVVKKMITEEEAVLKSGVMTWCGETLKKLCSTARVTSTNTERTVKIGGASNYDGAAYAAQKVQLDRR